ncbi:hypothetical protein J3R82DRAFT_3678 [Butyriboletus roseoflavus]|nr:hypothetical protein J3R82DRAFT_3678 [Butyriboletus roseoflavus]
MLPNWTRTCQASPTLHVIYCGNLAGEKRRPKGCLSEIRWRTAGSLTRCSGRTSYQPMSDPPPSFAMTMTSPPPNGPTPHSNAQLAELLTASYRESDLLRKDLAATRKRLEKAERLLTSYSTVASPSNANGTHSISEAAQRAITDGEARADRAEHARDEADARRRVLSDNWEELNRYLHLIELRAADARAGFARLVTEGGGQLVLTPVPLPGYHPQTVVHTPSAPSPAIMLVPPPRSHRHSASLNSSHGIPPLPPPPHPASRVRPRSGSLEDASYQPTSGQPPAKRSRNERDYDRRGRPLDVDVHHRSHLPSPHLALQPTLAVPRHSNPHPRSRSSSHSSQRSLSIDEMLLEASTDDPRPRGEPQSPRAVIAHHQHPNHAPTPNSQRSIVGHLSSSTPGPLEQPGEQRMYQTHIFAPPVTGAPMKKGKPGSTPGIMANGSGALAAPPITTAPVPPPPTPTAIVHQSIAAPPPPPVPHPHTPYPPTNAQGQRICRQCGLVGRYKDGKCVEKWGPGPEGPGTVCDRCRKKMKRVERRGSLAHAHSMSAHGNRATRTDTMPVAVGIGSGGTQLIAHATQMPSFISKDRRDRERIPTSSLAPCPSHHPPRSTDSQREPPSPPAIATLQTDDDESHRRGSADRGRRPMSSAAPPLVKHLPSPHSHSNSRRGSDESSADAEGDPDADGDADADADADAELLEAVHAAENRSSSMKAEDAENDD